MKSDTRQCIAELEHEVGKEACVDYLSHLLARTEGDWSWSQETMDKLRSFALKIREMGTFATHASDILKYVEKNAAFVPETLRSVLKIAPPPAFNSAFLSSLSDSRERMFADMPDEKVMLQIGAIVADAFCGKKEKKFVVSSKEEADKIKDVLIAAGLTVEVKSRSDKKENIICQW